MGAARQVQQDGSIRWECPECHRTYADLSRWLNHRCAKATQIAIDEAGGAFAVIEGRRKQLGATV